MMRLILPVLSLAAVLTLHHASAADWPPVEPADLSALSPGDFTDEELDMPDMAGPNFPLPYYLAHFHRLANAVVGEEGPRRGFIDLSVWRRPGDNEPYNARVMENILSLAWFYTNDRPWNPYHGDDATRLRLEAALEFWMSMQNEDGRFSEYGPNRWNLPATAFATKFMGETLLLLESGPPLTPGLLDRVKAANRKAIHTVLTREAYFEQGKRFSNQYGNVWAGALAHLEQDPGDGEIRDLLVERLDQGLRHFISPAGFFYEHNGPDWGYAFVTHHSNLGMAWHHARETGLAEPFRKEQAEWAEWLALNAPPEPDLDVFLLNRAIETRQTRTHLTRLETPLAEVVPLMRIYAPTREEVAKRRAAIRADVAANWPDVPGLRIRDFQSYGPYAFLHRRHHQWHPTDDERREALARHPVNARDRFAHQRVDDRNPLAYTYVRRPNYYAVFNAGPQVAPRRAPRLGLGLLWSPRTGVFFQSQTASDSDAWGTKSAGMNRVHEASPLFPEYRVDGAAEPWKSQPGKRGLPDGNLHIHYDLGENGRKIVGFDDGGVTVIVEHPGEFTEYLPFVLDRGETPVADNGKLVLHRNEHPVTLRLREAKTLEWSSPRSLPNGRELRTLRVEAADRLAYRIEPGDGNSP